MVIRVKYIECGCQPYDFALSRLSVFARGQFFRFSAFSARACGSVIKHEDVSSSHATRTARAGRKFITFNYKT